MPEREAGSEDDAAPLVQEAPDQVLVARKRPSCQMGARPTKAALVKLPGPLKRTLLEHCFSCSIARERKVCS